MQQQIHAPPVPPRRARPDAEITDAAEKLILKALSKRPEDRQQNMDDLRAELQTCYGSVSYRRNAPQVVTPTTPRPGRDTSDDSQPEPPTNPQMAAPSFKKDPPR
jgi:hypothetical protein